MIVKANLLLALLLVSLLVVPSMAKSESGKRDGYRRRLTPIEKGKGGKGGGGKGGCSKQTKGSDCSCESSVVKTIYYDEHLVHGQAQTLIDNGPLLIQATCQPSGVSLVLRLEWDSDLFVFGDLSEDQGLNDSPLVNQVLPTGTTFEKDMWSVGDDSEGNDTGDGAVWLSTGHFVGWGGDKTIGIHRTDRADLALADDNINCIVTGTIHCVIPEEFQD